MTLGNASTYMYVLLTVVQEAVKELESHRDHQEKEVTCVPQLTSDYSLTGQGKFKASIFLLSLIFVYPVNVHCMFNLKLCRSTLCALI